MSQSSSRVESVFTQIESTYGTIPNTGGTATVAIGDYIPFTRAAMNNLTGIIPRRDKTGSRGVVPGIRGRSTGQWSITMDLAGSGTAGTKPPHDVLLQCLFNKAANVSPGVSVTYSWDEVATFSASLYSFRSPSTMVQRCAHGVLVSAATFDFGADSAILSMEGPCQWVLESDQMAVASVIEKGGLTSFPTQPTGTKPSIGTMVVGFTGSFTFGGTVFPNLRGASLRIVTGVGLRTDVWNSYYGSGPLLAERAVTVAFSLYDEDTAGMTAMRTAANEKTPIDIILVGGTTAGNIWTFNINGVVPSPMILADGQINWTCDLGESRATETTAGAKDELTLVLT